MSYYKKNMSEDEFIKYLNECGCNTGIGMIDGGDGIEMLMQNLAKIHEYAGEVLTWLNNGNQADIEDWIEDKVSKAAQSIGDIKHYMEYKQSGYAIQQHGMPAHADIEGGSPMPLGHPEMPGPSSYGGGVENIVEPDMGDDMGSEIEIEIEPEMPYGEDDMISDLNGSSFEEEAEEEGMEHGYGEGYEEEEEIEEEEDDMGGEAMEENFSLKSALID
jgi:hypothetical protein